MTVLVTQDVLEHEGSWSDLDHIVDHFMKRRHKWSIPDVSAVQQSSWIQSDLNGRAGKRNLGALTKCYTASIYPDHGQMHSTQITVTRTPNLASEFLPADAEQFLREPLHVFVENEHSDGGFISAMVRTYNRNILSSAQTNIWFEFEHLGGFGEVAKRIDAMKLARGGRMRSLVVCDSDRHVRGQRTATQNFVENYCTANDVPLFVLEKRAIENYLPTCALQQLNSRFRRRVSAFLRLNQEQRDYFDMKQGFQMDPAGNTVVIPSDQTALFANVPIMDKRNLCGGFGGNCSALFTTVHITHGDMDFVFGPRPHEIEALLDRIERLL